MKEEYTRTNFVTQIAPEAVPDPFYIVTAHNPYGGRATDAENEEATAALLQQIRQSGWNHFPVRGQCEDHGEDGFGIECSRTEAVMLGEEFSQDAIYEVRDDKVTLIDCSEKIEDTNIGLWSGLRLLDL